MNTSSRLNVELVDYQQTQINSVMDSVYFQIQRILVRFQNTVLMMLVKLEQFDQFEPMELQIVDQPL
ncbi:hypothetical protein D3C76_1006080 [compost metagenome]